jgi:maleate cis-trans isomerase
MAKLASHSASGIGRRSFFQAAASAGIIAAAPALTLLGGAANPSNAHRVVGCIKPRPESTSLAELKRLLPPGIDVSPLYLNVAYGTREEFSNAFPIYERHLTTLAAQRVDLISIEGAPPFMIIGREAETRMVDGWKQKYGIDMFTSSQNQVNVLRALKVRNILGFSGNPDLNRSFTKYFEDSGIGVVAMEGIDVSFAGILELPPETISAFIRTKFRERPGADAIYILGSGLRALDLIAGLERDLGVPVVQAVAARVWEIQRRLHIHQPIRGFGTLLETLPA